MHEVRLETKDRAGAALLRAALTGLGVKVCDVVEQETSAGLRISVFFSQRDRALRLVADVRRLGLKKVRIGVRMHRRTDWETRWKENWKPFALTGSIHVIPLFLPKARCPRGKKPLFLDTTSAFGTGLHETTRFTSGIIEGLKGSFETALDIGTGTGILAVVMHMNGAGHVEAFDIDAGAVEVAARNFKANGFICRGLKTCDVGRYVPKRRFDLVAANLITHDLVAFKRKITACVRPGGYLVISGISLKNMRLVKQEYGFGIGLKCLKVVRGKEWAAFLFRKGGDVE